MESFGRTPGRPPILVTGATGQVGRAVTGALERRGAPVRLAARRPGRLGVRGGVAPVAFDFQHSSGWAAALEGCRGVFLLRPPAISDTASTLVPFVDMVREAGAGPVVFLSVAGAERLRWIPHHAVEEALRTGPDGWTLLRPGFFAQNLLSAYLDDIREDDRLYLPAGHGRVAFVDLRDVGEVAADALLDPEVHDGRAWTLTGPRAYTFAEVATLLSGALRRSIRYEPASIPGYLLHLRRRGLGWGRALVQTALHVGLRFGQAEAVDPTLGRLLGRPARSIEDFIQDQAERW